MTALGTALGIVAVASVGAVVAAWLRVTPLPHFVLAVLTFSAATVVLGCIVLSLAHQLTGAAILILDVVLAAGAIAAARWRKVTLPALSPPRLTIGLEQVRRHPALFVVASLALLVLVVQLVLGIAVAPNEPDSLSYHLSRAAYWLEFDRVYHYAHGSIHQTGEPPNAELLSAWVMALSHSDRLTQTVQWVALAGTATGVYVLARSYGFARAASGFAACLFVCMPQAILQGASPQNDLVASLFIVTAVAFALRAVRDASPREGVVAATAVGLAVGTKGTALMAALAASLPLAYFLWTRRPPLRALLFPTAAVALAVAVLGAFNYALNLKDTGTPFDHVTAQVKVDSASSSLPVALARDMWVFVDVPGGRHLHWAQTALAKPHNRLFRGVHRADFGTLQPVHLAVSESSTTYGLLGLLVLIPVVLYSLLPSRPILHRLVAVSALVYLVVVAAVTGFSPWVGRLYLPIAAVTTPLLAVLEQRRLLSLVAAGLALVGVIPCLFMNNGKPLSGRAGFLNGNRIAQETVGRPDLETALRHLDERLGKRGAVGFVGSQESPDYPFFGEQRERRVIRVDMSDATTRFMRAHRLRGIVFAETVPEDGPVKRVVRPPRGAAGIRLSAHYFLAMPG